jgi:hypothetical protein
MNTNYRPKVVIGKVKNTGYPIDGHELALALWDYDNYESYHLWSWADESDDAVMQTMYQAEKGSGIGAFCSLEEFSAAWKAKELEPAGAFLIPVENVEVVEVVQEEQKAGE